MGGGLLLVALAITCSILDACLCCVGGVCPRLNCTVTYMWLHPHNTIGVASLTPFTGVGEGCDAGVWRWWVSGLVGCLH